MADLSLAPPPVPKSWLTTISVAPRVVIEVLELADDVVVILLVDGRRVTDLLTAGQA